MGGRTSNQSFSSWPELPKTIVENFECSYHLSPHSSLTATGTSQLLVLGAAPRADVNWCRHDKEIKDGATGTGARIRYASSAWKLGAISFTVEVSKANN